LRSKHYHQRTPVGDLQRTLSQEALLPDQSHLRQKPRRYFYSFYVIHGTFELTHGCFSLGADPFANEDFLHCQEDDFQIQPEGVVVHIPDIELELLFPAQCVTTVHLRPAGDTGPYFMAPILRSTVER